MSSEDDETPDEYEPSDWRWLFPNGFLIVVASLALFALFLVVAMNRNPYS